MSDIGFKIVSTFIPVLPEIVYVLEWRGNYPDGPAVITIAVSTEPLSPRPGFEGEDGVRVLGPGRLPGWVREGCRFARVDAYGYPDFIRVDSGGVQHDDLTMDEVKFLTACRPEEC